jgi:hypothetical protein
MVVVISTVQVPEAIDTSSVDVGTPLGVHCEGSLQLPALPFQEREVACKLEERPTILIRSVAKNLPEKV